MKRIIIIIAALAAAAFFTGCNMVAGSGVIVETEFDLDGFKTVEAGNACNVTLTQGEAYSVKVSCDDNVVNLLDIKKEGDSLCLYLAPFTAYNRVTYNAEITMPEIDMIKAADASDMAVSGFESGDLLTIELKDASSADIKMISVNDVTADISDAARCVFTADVMMGDLDLNCSDASSADFRNASADNASVYVSDASDAWVNLSGELSGSVKDASSLYYKGTTNTGNLNVMFPSDLIRY